MNKKMPFIEGHLLLNDLKLYFICRPQHADVFASISLAELPTSPCARRKGPVDALNHRKRRRLVSETLRRLKLTHSIEDHVPSFVALAFEVAHETPVLPAHAALVLEFTAFEDPDAKNSVVDSC